MLIGYARVSTQDQNLDMQLDALNAYGCTRIYEDKQSGKNALSRPALQRMLEVVREGDTVIVYKLDRLGRSTKDLIQIVNDLKEAGVGFVSLSENIDTTTAQGQLIFTVFAALAEFERNVISERTKAGLEAARARGRKGGRRYELNAKQRQMVVDLYEAKNMTLQAIADQFNVSSRTISNYVKKS